MGILLIESNNFKLITFHKALSQQLSDISDYKILDNIPFGFIQIDVEGVILYANKSAHDLLELKALQGINFEAIPWKQINRFGKELTANDHVLNKSLKGETLTGIIQGLEINDVTKWISVNSSPVYDDQENIVGAIANVVDATEQIELENEITLGKERYEKFIAESPLAITIYDRTGLLIAANPKCEEYWRIPVMEYVGNFNIFQADLFSDEKSMARIRHAFGGQAGELTTTISLPHANNVQRSYRVKYYPLFDKHQELENVIYLTEDITEMVAAQEQTKREELLKQGILDALGDAILVVDENGTILNINKSLVAYLDKESYDGLKEGASVFDFLDFMEDREYLRRSLKSILSQEINFFDHELKLADGRWYNLRVTPLIGQRGAVISWQNVNTRKEIEMALEKSLKKYRNIYNKAPVMMHSINRDLQIISVSDFWLEKLGYERNEVIGRSPEEFLVEESKKDIKRNLDRLFKYGEVRNVEYQYLKKSGEIIEVLLSAVAEYDDEGNFERSITGMIDVTELKVAERQLQESQAKLLESQRISKIGNFELDIATGNFIPSAEMSMIMGLESKDENYQIVERLVHPDDLSEFNRKLDLAIKSETDFFHIFRIIHLKSKKIRWISARGRILPHPKNDAKMIGTVQDITEQRAAEDKIKRLTDRVLLATEIASLGVWEYDRETDEVFWEDQMFQIFEGFQKPVGIAEIGALFLEEDRDIIHQNLQLIQTGVNFLEVEVRININDRIKYLRSFTRVLRHESGKYKGMVGVVYDITSDKTFQKELEASLEEKNILIKEVHHRVKNNMQLISSIMALKSYDLKDEESKIIFEEVNNRIKSMSVIHDKLYTFYNVSEIDVSEYLQHIAQELQILLGSSSIKILVDSDRVIMNVDRALLIGLMVSELVSNAIKHGFSETDKGNITMEFKQDSNGYVLSVLNNGRKVPKDALDNNTGLGVSLIKTFVKQLHGEVEVDQRNGFRVMF